MRAPITLLTMRAGLCLSSSRARLAQAFVPLQPIHNAGPGRWGGVRREGGASAGGRRPWMTPTMVQQQARDAEAEAMLTKLLDDKTYHIEFNGYLSNHVKQALVALAGLGGDAAAIRGYWNEYTRVTPYGLNLDPAEPLDKVTTTFTEEDWERVLGKKVEFAALCRFFDEQERKLGTKGVLRRYMPTLVTGCPGALTHGAIHLGWGLDAGHRWMTIEGLAYMAYTHVSIHPERFVNSAHADAMPVQSLLRIADEWASQDVGKWVAGVVEDPKYSEASGFRKELVVTGFQWKVAKVLEEGHPLFYQLPAWLDTMDVPAMLEALYKAVTLLYLGTAGQPDRPAGPEQRGNFLVLHLITSLWGHEHILAAGDLEVEQQRQALKCFWVTLLALIFTTSGGFPTRAALEGVNDKFGTAADASPTAVQEGQDWEALVPLSMAEEEEHNIKLVYVERELWRRYGKWSGFHVAASSFTDTPNIGPGKQPFST